MNTLHTISVKEFAKSNNFTSIAPSIRTNSNGYPYITFIDASNKAENVYFSKASSSTLGAGRPVTKELLASYQVAETKNAEGEVRMKLVSNSSRVSIDSLLD